MTTMVSDARHAAAIGADQLKKRRRGMASVPADPMWWLTKDGDVSVLALYERHYSCYKYKDGRARKLFGGPGQKICLRTDPAVAAFVWKKFIDPSGQQGINCAFFRNEGETQSSELIRQADAIADQVWPSERHYTYVKPQAIRSTNPGYCFIRAGWRRCGMTKSGKIVLEKKEAADGR